jgi:magnesium chelatase family protein
MLARLYSVTLEGINGVVCEVEVDVARGGFEKTVVVGLPDAAVKESSERVKSAIVNSGFVYPKTQSLVNLAPADIKKEGPAFDLPIAVGMIAGTGALKADGLHDHVIVGELALDGRVRPVNGALSMAMAAKDKGYAGFICPLENAAEAAVVQGIRVYGVNTLAQTIGFLSGQLALDVSVVDLQNEFSIESQYSVDFSDVRGQAAAKRALTIAAAGSHNILMTGVPGAGKTMLAQRLATILPPLSLAESLETTRIYSSMGLLEPGKSLMARRPVRSPHHTASGPALVGGGPNARPGDLSLAHNGILFLDEFAEFPRHVLEMIRQPLEEGTVTVSRVKRTMTYPARFILVASLNPCPCGYYGSKAKRCRCTPSKVERYASKVSGPLMDRIDIHIDVPAMTFDKLYSKSEKTESSAEISQWVLSARKIQAARFGSDGLENNGTMSHRQVEQYCDLASSSKMMLKSAMLEFGLSARAHDKICKVARTIADLEPSDSIKTDHIAEAISYRRLDRKL